MCHRHPRPDWSHRPERTDRPYRDGDGRHWFDSSLLSLDNIGVTAHAGLTGILPLYAPVESLPVGSTTGAPSRTMPTWHTRPSSSTA